MNAITGRPACDDVRDIPDLPVAYWPRYYTRPVGNAVRCDHYYVHEVLPTGEQVWVCAICSAIKAVAP